MSKTKIEWTDRRWNPITGCTKISQGCKNCYAETMAKRFWGKRKFTDIKTHPERLHEPMRVMKPSMFFVNSMSDLFHPDIPFHFIDIIFAQMAVARWHTYQILTKRPERALEYFAWKDKAWVAPGMQGDERIRFQCYHYFAIDIDPKEWHWPLKNVWIGVSVEDETTARERIPILQKIPAAVKFLSIEPLIDRINIKPLLKGIDWVIVGGESGRGARPMHPDWVRTIRDECCEMKIPFFFKQWGEWCPADGYYETCIDTYLAGELQNGEETAVPLGMNNRSKKNFYWDNEVFAVRIGKKKAGRLLDGIEHNAVPGK